MSNESHTLVLARPLHTIVCPDLRVVGSAGIEPETLTCQSSALPFYLRLCPVCLEKQKRDGYCILTGANIICVGKILLREGYNVFF